MRHTFLNLNAHPIYPCHERGTILDSYGVSVPEIPAVFTYSDSSMTVKSGSIDTLSFTMTQTGGITATLVDRSCNYPDIDRNSR